MIVFNLGKRYIAHSVTGNGTGEKQGYCLRVIRHDPEKALLTAEKPSGVILLGRITARADGKAQHATFISGNVFIRADREWGK